VDRWLAWGIAATIGVFALLQSQAWSPMFVTVFRGNYLLLLSLMAARSALGAAPTISAPDFARKTLWRAFLKGLATHASSPNAVLIWVCVVGLALPRSAQRSDALWIVLGCGVIGLAVFGTYALAFSTNTARSVYRSAHRWFNAALSLAFAYAGVHVLMSGAHAG